MAKTKATSSERKSDSKIKKTIISKDKAFYVNETILPKTRLKKYKKANSVKDTKPNIKKVVSSSYNYQTLAKDIKIDKKLELKSKKNLKVVFPKIHLPKVNFPKINLSQGQRVFLAMILSLVLLGALIYVNIYGFSLKPFQPKSAAEQEKERMAKEIDNSPIIQEQIQKLQQITDSYDPLQGIVKKIKFKDLPIYPQNWVNANFNLTEQRNPLIAGPEGDADGDGLTNKEEYLYGSDPKIKNSLCLDDKAKTDFGDLCSLTDKQLIDKRISPLTGLAIGDEDTDLIVTNSDADFVNTIQNSFSVADSEGVDFTTLYQLSKKIDLTEEYQKVKVNSVPQIRQNSIDYLQFKSDFLKGFIKDSAVSSLLDIYKTSVVSEFDPILADYKQKKEALEKANVPEPEVDAHRRLTFVFEKLYNLASFRYQAVKDKTLIKDDFKAKSKQMAVEIVWAFRNLDQINAKKS